MSYYINQKIIRIIFLYHENIGLIYLLSYTEETSFKNKMELYYVNQLENIAFIFLLAE